MIKHIYQIFFFTFLFCLFSVISHAQTSAPRMINFQGVLVDEGGNVLYEIQEADVRFSIVDGAGEVLYEEIQHVPIVNGAVSVLVGNGNNPSTGAVTSGIPYDVFTSEGSKILRVKLEEYPIPQEDVQIVSVPYAYQAQSAFEIANPIESDNILDRTIQQVDLSEELLSFIESSITGVSEADLLSHRTESGAHPATSISVENTFVNTPGTNLQQVLQGLDNAVSIRGNQDTVIVTQIVTETAAREAADVAEADTREAEDENLQSQVDVNVTDISILNQAVPPIGTIIPFYDFDRRLRFDEDYWHYCDGSTISIPDYNGVQIQVTLPDLSNRYLVGFGDEGERNIGAASLWPTESPTGHLRDLTVVGEEGHEVNLEHAHTMTGHTHSANPSATASGVPSTNATSAGGTGPTDASGTGPTGEDGTGATGAGSEHDHSVPAHHHDDGTLAISESGGHTHDVFFYAIAGGGTLDSNAGDPNDNQTHLTGTHPAAALTNTHTHANGDFTGLVGNTEEGVDGDAAMTSEPESSHTHTGPNHTHTGPSHTHAGPSHTHDMGDHTHDTDIDLFMSGSTIDIMDDKLNSPQSIQPRSVRVRYIMRIK